MWCAASPEPLLRLLGGLLLRGDFVTATAAATAAFTAAAGAGTIEEGGTSGKPNVGQLIRSVIEEQEVNGLDLFQARLHRALTQATAHWLDNRLGVW